MSTPRARRVAGSRRGRQTAKWPHGSRLRLMTDRPILRQLPTYSPLGAGFLTGKYTPGRTRIPKGTRFDIKPDHMDVYFKDKNFRIVELLKKKASELGIPMVRLAMASAMTLPLITSTKSVRGLPATSTMHSRRLRWVWMLTCEQRCRHRRVNDWNLASSQNLATGHRRMQRIRLAYSEEIRRRQRVAVQAF